MRQVGTKRRALLRERKRIIARMEPVACPRCHLRPATDVHERVRRSQHAAGAADESMMIQLCRQCHDDVTLRPSAQDFTDGWVQTGWAYRRDITGDSIPDMPPETRTLVSLRIPADLLEEIDDRRAKIGEASRNAWMERALRWAVAQPVKVTPTEEQT